MCCCISVYLVYSVSKFGSKYLLWQFSIKTVYINDKAYTQEVSYFSADTIYKSSDTQNLIVRDFTTNIIPLKVSCRGPITISF